MRSIVRQLRRAPARVVSSIFALALAVGAIGVLAIPTIASDALREAVEHDQLGDVIVPTTPVDDVARVHVELSAIDGVESVDLTVRGTASTTAGQRFGVVGFEQDHDMDLVRVVAGRDAVEPGEAVASPGLAEVGDTIRSAGGTSVDIVGVGTTLWWGDESVLYTDAATAALLTGEPGPTRLSISAVDDTDEGLGRIVDEARVVLATDGSTFTELPVQLPGERTPIEDDIDQVSTLIGMLGVVAGLVALVLLASTTNTLITERTREIAVMRALGARARPLRRRLRRVAIAIAVAAVALGIPLGVLIANVIARMVLEEFVGITPDLGYSVPVMLGSAAFALLGARIVSARAARRVTKEPLATALRDRDGRPFGRRWTERSLAALPTGGLPSRMAVRAATHRPARALAISAQVAAAVAAVVIITSLTTSVTAFNGATRDPWTWDTMTRAQASGLVLDAGIADGRAGDATRAEAGIWVDGEVDGWELDVYGLADDTEAFVGDVVQGRRAVGGREVLVSDGFVERTDLEVGDTVVVDLATGPTDFVVVGTVDDHARAVYADRDQLGEALGAAGMANVVWSVGGVPDLDWPGDIRTTTASELDEDDEAARSSIVSIFGAIAIIVAGVAALAVVSTLAVDLHERRHEVATLRAIGARRWKLRGIVAREVLGLGVVGVAGGIALGWLGAVGIIASFEASNAVDIGTVFASGALPVLIAGTTITLVLVAVAAVRSASRRPVAEVLRGAA